MDELHTVMIVDDNADDRYSLTRYLKKTELSLLILEVSSGIEGIELLTTSRNQLEAQHPGINAPITLFLDINMPLMNGWEFIEELERRQSEIELEPYAILMYSSSDGKYDRDKARNYKSVDNYIVKGDLTPENLQKVILEAHQ